MYGHGLAVLAGFCACMAATCAKLAFNQDVVNSIYKSICFLVHVQQNQALSEQVWKFHLDTFSHRVIIAIIKYTIHITYIAYIIDIEHINCYLL